MIYPYRCYDCGWQFERVCSLAEYQRDPGCNCPACKIPMRRVITPPRIFTRSFEPFVSPVDGSIIGNSRELSEHNKRNNVVQLHEGYDEKAVSKFTERDWAKEKEEERRKSLHEDMQKSIQKLEQGYKPVLAPHTEDCPDAPDA